MTRRETAHMWLTVTNPGITEPVWRGFAPLHERTDITPEGTGKATTR